MLDCTKSSPTAAFVMMVEIDTPCSIPRCDFQGPELGFPQLSLTGRHRESELAFQAFPTSRFFTSKSVRDWITQAGVGERKEHHSTGGTEGQLG